MATSIIKTDELRLLNDQVVMSDGALTENVAFPAGHVIQVVQSKFTPSHESTTNDTYQPSSVFKIIQKNSTSSKILATLSGGHGYVSAFSNGLISTICQTSSATSFTPTTTYSSGDDPTNNSRYGMEQIYNNAYLNATSHSISWLFESSGNEFEGFRCFFKSRVSGRGAIFHEDTTSYLTLTLMEIAQ